MNICCKMKLPLQRSHQNKIKYFTFLSVRPSFSGVILWIATKTSAGVNAGPVCAEPCLQLYKRDASYLGTRQRLRYAQPLLLETRFSKSNNSKENAISFFKMDCGFLRLRPSSLALPKHGFLLRVKFYTTSQTY